MKLKQIPQGFIEDADIYKLMPMDTYNVIELGGRIMFKLVVLDQMTSDNIVATSGLQKVEGKVTEQKTLCIIIVSYSQAQVVEMIGNARRQLGKLVERGGDL